MVIEIGGQFFVLFGSVIFNGNVFSSSQVSI